MNHLPLIFTVFSVLIYFRWIELFGKFYFLSLNWRCVIFIVAVRTQKFIRPVQVLIRNSLISIPQIEKKILTVACLQCRSITSCYCHSTWNRIPLHLLLTSFYLSASRHKHVQFVCICFQY